MKTGKYTPEITERAVRMLIEIMCDTDKINKMQMPPIIITMLH